MTRILVVNNPSSFLAFYTEIQSNIDEVWMEYYYQHDYRNKEALENAKTILRISNRFKVKSIDTISLHELSNHKILSKVYKFRKLSKKVDDICRENSISSIVCSTTSIFRLASVAKINVIDHGTGDYLRPNIATWLDRFKYSFIYSRFKWKNTIYSSFVPLPYRKYIGFDIRKMKELFGELNMGFREDRVNIVLLGYPNMPLKEQLKRLNKLVPNRIYDIYLKPHIYYLKNSAYTDKDLSDNSDLIPVNCNFQILPPHLSSLPVELLVLGADIPVKVAGFSSTALWHIGLYESECAIGLGFREEIMNLSALWGKQLGKLEEALNYSPFRP